MVAPNVLQANNLKISNELSQFFMQKNAHNEFVLDIRNSLGPESGFIIFICFFLVTLSQ